MPLYDVTDTDSGMTLTLEGDSPPNEQELEEIFRQLKPAQPPESEKPKPGPIELAARARGAVAPMTEEARAAGEKPLVEDLVPWQVNAAADLGVPGAKTVQAVTRGLTKPIAAMTSPTGAALTAATIAMPQIGIPLGIGMGAVGIPSAYQKTREGISEGNLEKTIEGLTEGGLSTGMLVGGVAGIGGLLARKPVLPMTSQEAGIPAGEPTLSKADVERLFLQPEQARTDAELAKPKAMPEEKTGTAATEVVGLEGERVPPTVSQPSSAGLETNQPKIDAGKGELQPGAPEPSITAPAQPTPSLSREEIQSRLQRIEKEQAYLEKQLPGREDRGPVIAQMRYLDGQQDLLEEMLRQGDQTEPIELPIDKSARAAMEKLAATEEPSPATLGVESPKTEASPEAPPAPTVAPEKLVGKVIDPLARIDEELAAPYATEAMKFGLLKKKTAIQAGQKEGKSFVPYQNSKIGSNKWSVAEVATGREVEFPVTIDHPELGKTSTTRLSFKTKGEAQKAIDAQTKPTPPVSPGPGAPGAREMKDLGAATPASIPSAPSNFRHWYDVHIGRPGAKLAPTVKRLWNTGSVRHAIAGLKDWSENSARLFARSQANDIRQPLRRLAKKDFKVADNALSMVVESKGSYAALQEMRLKLTASTQADPWWRKQALDALDYATYHWDELSKLAKDYKGITKAQVGIENASDIPTLEREGYVPHRQEIEELDLLTKTGQGGSTFFEKPRVYETFADSIAAGVDPRTLSATDLLEHRVNSGMRLVNSRKWMDSLRQLKDPETKAPIATNLKPLKRADGSKVMVPPTGYVAEMIGPHSVAILKGYEGIFSALTDPSFFTKSMAGRGLMTANATGKSVALLIDTFHLGRLAFWDSLIKALGVRTFKAPFPTYRRGITLLDFTTNQIQEMATAGEIPQRWLNTLLEDKRRLDLAVKSGYNVGRISDALYQDLIHSIPGLGTFNKWLFDQFQRGAMAESWLLEFERAKRASPKLPEAELAKQVSYDLNVRFGNLGRQGWFKSRGSQDLARLIALAPQWNEGLIKSEWGAVREAGQFIRDAATGRRIYAGVLLRSVGAMALMQFIANQVLNQATRGKFTWDNPEEGWGAKISAWIPDVTGNGPGFFLHPLGLAAETVHLLTNLYERSGGDTSKVATDYLRSRSSAVMRPILAAITRSDFLGRKFKPGTVWWEVAKTAIPVPIAGGAVAAAGKQIVTGQPSEQFAGQYQKQAMASMGVRTESAPSPGQRIARLAAEWRREKGIPSNEAFYGTGDYQPLVQALRIGNLTTAKEEIVKLRKTHTDAEIRQHFNRWQRAPFTGSHAREREFRRQLTAKQQIAYIKARNERARVSAELRKLLR